VASEALTALAVGIVSYYNATVQVLLAFGKVERERSFAYLQSSSKALNVGAGVALYVLGTGAFIYFATSI
jgi:hypothetical protein